MAVMPWKTSRPAPSTRGMGAEHNKRRAALIAQLKHDGVARCCLGGEPLYAEHIGLPNAHPLKPVLDHCACRTGCPACGWTGYRGLACWQHNASDGGSRGRERQTVATLPRWR